MRGAGVAAGVPPVAEDAEEGAGACKIGENVEPFAAREVPFAAGSAVAWWKSGAAAECWS